MDNNLGKGIVCSLGMGFRNLSKFLSSNKQYQVLKISKNIFLYKLLLIINIYI